MLSELKSSTDNERAELSNELLTFQQSLTERTKELQRLQENFDQVSSVDLLRIFGTNSVHRYGVEFPEFAAYMCVCGGPDCCQDGACRLH